MSDNFLGEYILCTSRGDSLTKNFNTVNQQLVTKPCFMTHHFNESKFRQELLLIFLINITKYEE